MNNGKLQSDSQWFVLISMYLVGLCPTTGLVYCCIILFCMIGFSICQKSSCCKLSRGPFEPMHLGLIAYVPFVFFGKTPCSHVFMCLAGHGIAELRGRTGWRWLCQGRTYATDNVVEDSKSRSIDLIRIKEKASRKRHGPVNISNWNVWLRYANCACSASNESESQSQHFLIGFLSSRLAAQFVRSCRCHGDPWSWPRLQTKCYTRNQEFSPFSPQAFAIWRCQHFLLRFCWRQPLPAVRPSRDAFWQRLCVPRPLGENRWLATPPNAI